MNTTTDSLIETDAAIATWFGVGGRADALARPASERELRELLLHHDNIRILGEGSNLLVDDAGVDGLVISLECLTSSQSLTSPGSIRVGAGTGLPKLIIELAKRGLGGLEPLAGVPASVGGAVYMNAGGSFGQIADVVTCVHALDQHGQSTCLDRSQIDFKYRSSGLDGLIITSADLQLTPGDPQPLRERLKEVFAAKGSTQPLAARSAGCVFKNPLIQGERTSAGALIDRAGCKGMSFGAARVSDRHANFIITSEGARAADVLTLIDMVRERTLQAAGVELETEIVIWRRGQTP